MSKVSEYMIEYHHCGEFCQTYIQALSAQQAVDFIRGNEDEIEIVDVWKIVHNWK